MADYPTGALKTAYEHAIEFLYGLSSRPVGATKSIDELRSALEGNLPARGTAPEAVIEALVEATEGGHLGSAGGRFFAWVIGGSLPSALAADWLASTWDNNATIAACGPAAAVVEERAGAWVKELLGLPGDASFAFTTGCQMAHFTCLAAARHALLKRAGHNVEAHGLWSAPPIRVLSTEHRHGSVTRALRFLGLGSACLQALETDEVHRLTADTVDRALGESDAPTIMILDAADLNVGAMDDFEGIIPIARAAGAWVHIDGAFGLWARASDRHAHLAKGVELADSWATDAHKWLNTPKDNGMAIVRDVEAHRAAMTIGADYIPASTSARDQIDWTPEWTRRARGIPVYAAVHELGRAGIAEMIDRCCDMAKRLADGLAKMPGIELVSRPTLNQGLVRFLDPRNGATDEQHNAFTDAMIDAINAEGTAFFSGTLWKGRRAMRISVVNWQTDANDVYRTLDAISRINATRRGDVRPTSDAGHDWVI